MRELHLLMVDDDAAQRRALRRAVLRGLERVQVLEAGDGGAALAALREKGPPSGRRSVRYLVLLDLEMAPVDGFGFLAQLRRDPDWGSTIVFVLSGRADATSHDRAYRYDIAGYIRKDLVDEEMTQVLDLVRAYQSAVCFPGEAVAD
jgi:CheY-like chemotaxis protein